jgi:phosphoribosyl 1,2-cyclic phosphodiesterase
MVGIRRVLKSVPGNGRSFSMRARASFPLGRELARTKRAHEIMLLFSHLHHDHTQGFPFFVPAYLPSARLHIFGPDGTHESLKNVLEHNQSSETFPVSLREMASSKDIQAVRESQVIVWDETGVRVADQVSASVMKRS